MSARRYQADSLEIRAAVLDGDIDKALKRTQTCYPAVLRDNPRIYFRLRCRRFVEMMRQPSSPPTPRTKSSKQTHHVDVFEQDMELDEPDDWDKMETDSDPMVEALRYAQELQLEYKDDRSREVKDALHDIFALFAYEDPRTSPMMQLTDPSGRVPVAEELNSAILGMCCSDVLEYANGVVSLGKSSSAAIERLCQQTEVLVSDVSDHGGSGAFVNLHGDFLR